MATEMRRPLCTCDRVPHAKDCPVCIIAGVLYRRFSSVSGIPYRNEATCEIAEALSKSDKLHQLMTDPRTERALRPEKRWDLCPYKYHANDCDCRGEGGDR